MKITDLTGEALKTAIQEERETEWNGCTSVTDKDVISLSLANNTEYDQNGNFVRYGN